MLANASDGHVSDEEVRGFLTVLLRMKLYKDMTQDQLRKVVDRVCGIINRTEAEAALAKFAEALPEPLHRAAFANACDLVLADGVVEEEEKQFIGRLRQALKLSGDDARTIAQVMVYKNQG